MKNIMQTHGAWLRRGWLVLLTALLAAGAMGQNFEAVEVVKSPNDQRRYRALQLDNRLSVILISDPQADKAAAAMDVQAGSNSDPDQYPGLAHFLEHMLFLGTEKYPEAGAYQAYIASHGGSHNAYTAYENTNYYFDIEPAYLEGALDRFSQFFIAPLLTADYVDRERNAVHSEYQSNLRDDGRRSYSIFKEAINQDHPLSRFSVGSLETLPDGGDGALRRALLRHYEDHYSANIMSLAILGNESLDELEALVRRYFSALPDRDAARPATDYPLFEEGTLPRVLRIRPVRDTRSMSLTFPVPPPQPYYKSKPLNYLGNVIGHEGEGSLLALLRERGLANRLSAGGGMVYRDNATFSVNISLTEAGVARVDEIASLVFDFIELTRRRGIQPWLFGEQRTMADIRFRFQEPSRPIGYVSSLARRLLEYPPAELLTAPYAFEQFDAALIERYLSYLRPENAMLTVTHQGVETDRVDPEFGGEFSLAPVPDERLAEWRADTIDPVLAIPDPNPFLPEDLSIKPYDGPEPGGVEDKPELIVNRDGVDLWFKQDTEFNVPRANFYFYAMTPLFSASLENSLLARFVVNLVNDQLNEYAYPAQLAGLGYSVSRRSRGFSVRIGGYNDKQPVLLEEVLRTLSEADFEQERFDIIKTEMIRGWENADQRMPYARLFQEIQALLVEPYWSEEERIEAVRDITLADVEAFAPRMLEDLTIDALYHGNVVEADALAMMDLVTRYLDASEAAGRPPFGTVVNMVEGRRVIFRKQIEHQDSAIVMYLQGPDDSLRTRATINLLSAIIRTPFYDQLRTEQQLGYVVSAGTLPILDTNGLVMYIESPRAGPVTLENRIDAFLRDYESELAAMSRAAFEDIKSGLLNNLRQKPQRLGSLSSRYWNDILVQEYERDSNLAMADMVESLDKPDVLDYYRRWVGNTDAGRLVTWSVGTPHQQAFSENVTEVRGSEAVFVESYDAFKNGAEVFIFQPDRPAP